jgi:hypothetical protein
MMLFKRKKKDQATKLPEAKPIPEKSPEQKEAPKKEATFKRFKTESEAEGHKAKHGGIVVKYKTKKDKEAFAWKAK